MQRFETMNAPGTGWPPSVGKYRPDQIANMQSWGQVPDSQMTMASLHSIHMVPNNRSTMTYMNPLDPGDQANTNWYEAPADMGRVIPARNLYGG
jgi:hypothetical protein